MALRWLDGFDVNTSDDGDGLSIRYASVTLPPTVVFVSGRGFGSAVKAQLDPFKLTIPAFTDDDTLVVGFNCLFSGTADVDLLTFYRGGTVQLKVTATAASEGRVTLAVMRGATELDSITLDVPDDWIHLEFKVKFHTTTGTFEMRLNGVTMLSGAGLNTADSGSNDADQVQLWIEVDDDVEQLFVVDNLVILDSTGGVNDDFLGEMVIEEKLSREDGTYQEWATKNEDDETHTENVADEAEPDGNETYNAAGTINLTDTFIMSPLFALLTVAGVQVEVVTAQQETPIDDDHVKIVTYVDGNEYVSDNQLLASVQPTYESHHYAWDLNPDTTDPWTPEELAMTEFGVRSQA